MPISASKGGARFGGGGGTVTPVAPTLQVLTLSPSTGTVGVAGSWTIGNRTAGSTFTLLGTGAAGLTVNNTTGVVSGTPTTAGDMDIRETLAGATGSPKTTPSLLAIASAPASLDLSATTFKVTDDFGAAIGNFTGLDAGETVTAISPSDGKVAVNAAGTALVVGLVASSAGSTSYTFTTSASRTLTKTLTVSEETIPFLHDDNTLWYDMTASDNLEDNNGVDTLSWIKERIRGRRNISAPIKAQQPLKVTGGAQFNNQTARNFQPEQLPTLTNGKHGWYIAAVVTQEASGVSSEILQVSRASSSAAVRADVLMSSSRQPGAKAAAPAASEASSSSYLGLAPAVTLGTKIAFEALWDQDADTFTIWVNGVAQTLSGVALTGPWDTFPATNPLVVVFGNNTNLTASFAGIIGNIVLYDGVPSSEIRASISADAVARAAA